jgi:REP element-mobilizing transposase RayT
MARRKGKVLAYHIIITPYGFWLPNDPRGSWSDFVRAWELQRFGPATKTSERRSLAHDAHDRKLRLAAKQALAHEPVEFNGLQARTIARGFAEYAARNGLVILACSILPTHVHLVVLRHTCRAEQVANLLKGAATRQLTLEGMHPFRNEPYRDGTLPTPWARKCWKCFLSDADGIRRAIEHVEENPMKEGLKRQRWKMVVGFVGL